MAEEHRFQWPVRPVAERANVVCGSCYRFTVLTDALIRMEYDPSGVFEDRASQSVFYRDFPETVYSISRENGVLTLETKELVLFYQEGEAFSEDTLTLRLKQEPASVWHYGEDFEELGGTVQTLDTINGAIPLGRGVCSRNGFSVLDDSETLVLDETGWIAVRKPDTIDVYFFGYGFRYRDAVADLYRLTGVPPLLPDYALGNWWSRYYKYTQQEYIDLMERFKKEDIPFSVSVVDMDWHLVDIPEEYKDENDPLADNGWTGYTWNEDFFPNYKEFLRYLNDNNLKTALNLHPHAGVRRFDSMYEEMAKACGVDPASGKRIPFNILSPEFMEHYFDILHHPYEEAGVDFWWMDWQQGTDYWWIHERNVDGKMQDEREILNPLWMLNHLHILDISRNGKRPMFFSRYSGPGSQRYPVGFSGDTVVTWESLRFQPYFTATASNIGYSWWSHDIGGHYGGYRDDELNTRWVQLGVFSPINRLHSTNSRFMGKEPWNYGKEHEMIVKDWLRMRQSLFPYLYTMNYRNHTELLPLVQPMYYSHPKCDAAYEVPTQFWFGSELIVAPITEKKDAVSLMGKTNGWLPKGDWFDFFSGMHYTSKRGRKLELYRYLDEYPVFAKAGAIVPMMERTAQDNHLGHSEGMEVFVFPGAENTFTLYEDEGDYDHYQKGAFATTQMKLHWGETAQFVIEPAEGDCTQIPKKRRWKLHFRGFHRGAELCVSVDGMPYEAEIVREKETNTFVAVVEVAVTSRVVVTISGETLIHDNCDVPKRYEQILARAQTEYEKKQKLFEIYSVEGRRRLRLLDGCGTIEQQGLKGALREVLTLTEEE